MSNRTITHRQAVDLVGGHFIHLNLVMANLANVPDVEFLKIALNLEV